MNSAPVPPEALIARLALARGWIGREAYHRLLHSPDSGTIDDGLLAAGLTTEQLRTLRGALGDRRKDAWVGDWRLIRRVGIGGMGSVFEARHRRTGRRAAVKLLLPRLGRDADFAFRFLREARALARISHPNVVHAYDAGQDGEFYFIAMELVDGQDLQRCLEKDGCLSPPRSLEVVLAVARALRAIAQAGLVHRDVKPANILIDAAGAVKLVDLGLFHDDLDPGSLGEDYFFGTPQYMSPEQVLGRDDIDSRSDLYSLGATWYHALIGRPPFTGEPLAVARAQVEAVPTPPREIRPDLPLSLDRLILRLLEKDPVRRFSGPGEAVEAIEAVQSALAPKKSKVESRKSKAVRPWALVLGAGFLCLAMVARLSWWPVRSAGNVTGPSVATPDSSIELLTFDFQLQKFDAARAVFASSVERTGQGLLAAVQRALPRPWNWGAGGPTGAQPPSEAGRLPQETGGTGAGAAAALPAAKDAPLPAEVESWAASGAVLAMTRLGKVVAALPEGLELPVVLRDGRAVIVRAAGREGGLRSAAGSEVPVPALHPVVVIAWAGHDPAEPLPDAGVALAIAEGLHPLAVHLAETLLPELPPAVESFLKGTSPLFPVNQTPGGRPGVGAEPRDSAAAFLARALKDLQAERSARASLAGGRYREAVATLDSLLSGKEASALSPLSRVRWEVLKQRSERIASFSIGLFARPATALDPLRGEVLAIVFPFDTEAELSDFRLDGRAWTLRDGALERLSGRRAKPPSGARSIQLADPADTVALFSPPLTVEGEWEARPGEAASRLAVGFAGCFVGLGGPVGPVVWRGELPDGVFPLSEDGGAGRGGRRFRIEFRDGGASIQETAASAPFAAAPGVELAFPASAAPAVPPPGRVAIGLSPGARLHRLSITGTPDTVWGEARIAAGGSR